MKVGDLIKYSDYRDGPWAVEYGLIIEVGEKTYPPDVLILWHNGDVEHVYEDEIDLVNDYVEIAFES